MPLSQLIIIYLIQMIFLLFPIQGYRILFNKLDHPSKYAHLPFINSWVMLNHIYNKKIWIIMYFIAQFIPIIGWFVSMNLIIDFLKRMNVFGFVDYLKFLFLGFIFSVAIAKKHSTKPILKADVKKHKKGFVREWTDAAIYAVIVAYLFRTFFFEAFAIPTSSMEGTMLINDYLFVNKFKYGFRLPLTPISIPFIHHTVPGIHTKAYSEAVSIPYTRWFEKEVKRNDVVVFNFPVGDTVINKDGFQSAITYYSVVRQLGHDRVLGNKDQFPLVVRPLDKRENFVKRCVAIPGDELEIKDGILYINHQKAEIPTFLKRKYVVYTKERISKSFLINTLNINTEKESGDFYYNSQNGYYIFSLTPKQAEMLSKSPEIEGIEQYSMVDSSIQVFPHDKTFHWTNHNFGPLWIPKKGHSITLNDSTFTLYQRVIHVYEKANIVKKNDGFYKMGKKIDQYTFKHNYYWMMGDNRDNSLDSRYWGFVPKNHIIGSPSFIWFSTNEKGIRWNRLFQSVN